MDSKQDLKESQESSSYQEKNINGLILHEQNLLQESGQEQEPKYKIGDSKGYVPVETNHHMQLKNIKNDEEKNEI